MSSHHNSTEQDNYLKVFTVISTSNPQSFSDWAGQAFYNGNLLLGSDRGNGSQYEHARQRQKNFARQYKRYISDPDSSSHWIPLDRFSSDPSNYLQVNHPIRKLTEEEFHIQKQKGSSPDIQETMSRGRNKNHSHSPMGRSALNNER